MSPPTPDELAREAARLIDTGKAESIGDALRETVARLPEGSRGGLTLPGHGRVRRHLQGLTMQSVGEAEYNDSVRAMWRTAEEVMTALESCDPLLAGRAAKGYIDGGVTLHIRIYTRQPIGDIAAMLVDLGYDEPEFETINTRFGRLNRLRFEEEGWPICITRCLPNMYEHRAQNLYRDESISVMDLRGVRARIDE